MIGQKLNNRYKINSLLGEGGMGEVYLAEDKSTRQKVAVKILARQLSAQPESLERFRREAETLRQLDHPNIVKFVDTFEHEGQYVIVMEYVPGGSLHDLVKQGPLSIEQARRIALDLGDALIRSHHMNIIHRDIKPENVLLTEDGRPKLADFGVARLNEGDGMTRTGTQVGTPYYMAPEAWEGKILDAQADIWSLGVVFFEMLTGHVPFNGDTPLAVMSQVRNSTVPNIRKLRSDAPTGMIKIIKRMLARDQKKRYQTMREVVVDLEQGFAGARTARLRLIPLGLIVLVFAGVLLSNALNVQNSDPVPTIPVINFTATKELPTPTPTTAIPTETATLVFTSTPSYDIGSTMVSEIDGMVLVYVPAGEFPMGSRGVGLDEQPVHQVYLDAYWIDQTEVSIRMYSRCVDANACQLPVSLTIGGTYNRIYYDAPGYLDYPVVHVNWHMAKAYCEWTGRTLPTEAQWEKAARGTDGRTYPWGEGLSCDKGGFFIPDLLNCQPSRAPVVSYPSGRSPYGAYTMAGNVIEWVSSLYKPYPYDPNDGREDMNSLDPRVMRSGSAYYYHSDVRSANRSRDIPNSTFEDLGFRCALPINK